MHDACHVKNNYEESNMKKPVFLVIILFIVFAVIILFFTNKGEKKPKGASLTPNEALEIAKKSSCYKLGKMDINKVTFNKDRGTWTFSIYDKKKYAAPLCVVNEKSKTAVPSHGMLPPQNL